MSDGDRKISNGDVLGFDDDERLPWLESVEDYDGGGSSTFHTIGFVLIGLFALAMVVGGIYWLQNRDGDIAEGGDGSLIAAQEGDYKVSPENPEGKVFDGVGDASPSASAGEPTFGKLADKPTVPVAPAAIPGTAPGGKAALVQLGAFGSAAAAEQGWSTLTGKFSFIGALPKKIEAAKLDSGTVYRLSAIASNAGAAQNVCGQLKAAGQSCLVVQ